MWKWTELDHLKVIILDGDSLDQDYLHYDYPALIPNCKIYPVTMKNKTGMISYFDITNLLYTLIQESGAESFQFLSISGNPQFLKEMMQNHIGTILVGQFKKEYLKYIPDFMCLRFENIPSILQQKRQGYAAEVIACHEGAKKKNLLSCVSSIKLSNNEIKNYKLYFGGRYYAKNHRYLADDPLSTLILEFKNKPVKLISEYYDQAISFIHSFEEFDILTYVPLKKDEVESGRFNRFKSLELDRCNQENLILRDVVSCRRTFSQKRNDAVHRKENVQGAYFITQDIRDQKILILDDVYSSGATINEIVKTLYEAGAAHVSALFAGVNQLTESPAHPYQAPVCQVCGGRLALKFNNKSDLFFWGCTNFAKGCHFTQAWNQGLNEMRQVNTVKAIDLTDLDDNY